MAINPVSRIRRFNRAVTRQVGALDTSFLGRGRPLGSARVLNAVGRGVEDVAAIRRDLGLDSALMSRLLRGLEKEGLIETATHRQDARRRTARLTASGEAEFAAYEALSDSQAGDVLAGHPHPEAVLEAMDLVATALGRQRIRLDTLDPTSEPGRYCLGEYYAELARRFESGFDVSLSRDPEAGDMRRPRGAFIVAISDGQPVGCVGLKGTGGPTGEIKRLWVAPPARGLGLAKRLMAEAEATARDLSMTRLRLDTNRALPEAIHLYRSHGWREIARFNDDPYPDFFFEKSLLD